LSVYLHKFFLVYFLLFRSSYIIRYYLNIALDWLLTNGAKYIYAIVRENWDLRGWSSMFEYLFKTLQMYNVSAKILSAQQCSKSAVHPPRLNPIFKILDESQTRMFNNLFSDLCRTADPCNKTEVAFQDSLFECIMTCFFTINLTFYMN
jgi:hypothetical protein